MVGEDSMAVLKRFKTKMWCKACIVLVSKQHTKFSNQAYYSLPFLFIGLTCLASFAHGSYNHGISGWTKLLVFASPMLPCRVGPS